MRKDLSHLLVGNRGSSGGCGCVNSVPSVARADQSAAQAVQEDAAGPYWNMFAHPVKLGDSRYVFLSDERAVLKVDEQTFEDVEQGRGRAVADEIEGGDLQRLVELALVRPDSPKRQFSHVFSHGSSRPGEAALLHLITSYTCNLTCSYCFMLADLDNHKERFLTFDQAKRGIDLYFSRPHRDDSVVHFYGGEPLLHPELVDDCLKYIHARHSTSVLPKIITNGTLHGARVLNLLQRYTFDLSVSIDGDREAHDVFRLDHQGRSSYEATLAGVRAFQDIGCNPKILITVGAHNIARLPRWSLRSWSCVRRPSL